MSDDKNQAFEKLSEYIKGLKNQEVKVLLLKLKNELRKEDVTWQQVRDILSSIEEKDNKVLFDIMPLILHT